MKGTGVVTSITNVFEAVGSWLVKFITQLIPIFYDTTANEGAGGLTFLGVLAVIGLAISVFFLVMGVIQNFLHLRG